MTIDHAALRIEVDSEVHDAQSLLDAVRDVVEQDHDLAQETMREARHRWRVIDGRRTSITKPMNEAKRAVDALFNPILSIYREIDRIATQADAKHRLRIAEEKQRALYAATNTTEIVAASTPIANVEGVSTRRGPAKVRIVNAALVPEEYWIRSLNDAKAKLAFAAGNPVPGLEIYHEEIAVVK